MKTVKFNPASTRFLGRNNSSVASIADDPKEVGPTNLLQTLYDSIDIWVVVKIMVPFWVPNIVRHLTGFPKRDHNFDNHPYGTTRVKTTDYSDCFTGLWSTIL